jgi:hypothetical protein
MNATFGLRSVLDRRLQRGDGDAGVHRSADRVSQPRCATRHPGWRRRFGCRPCSRMRRRSFLLLLPRPGDAVPPRPAGSRSTRTHHGSCRCGRQVRPSRGEQVKHRRRRIVRGPSARILFGQRWRGARDDGGGRASRRRVCFEAPFSSSISSAWRPTIRSRAAILASNSWIRSAARASSSKARASNLPTQIRISWREMSWRLDNACSVSPVMNSSATCRLNAALCDRCFVIASILRKPARGVNPDHLTYPPSGAHSRSASKIDPILETGATGGARPGGAGLGCAAGKSAVRSS